MHDMFICRYCSSYIKHLSKQLGSLQKFMLPLRVYLFINAPIVTYIYIYAAKKNSTYIVSCSTKLYAESLGNWYLLYIYIYCYILNTQTLQFITCVLQSPCARCRGHSACQSAHPENVIDRRVFIIVLTSGRVIASADVFSIIQSVGMYTLYVCTNESLKERKMK